MLREVTRLTDWIETADEYPEEEVTAVLGDICLLYTSDAADE